MEARDTVRRFALLPEGSRVLCALSGGPDSVCLTHFLAKNAGAFGITVAAAHFSHGLRPDKAEEERALCARLCESLNIPLFCGAGDTRALAKEKGMSEEEAARTLRRAFLLETADAWDACVIATGHHLQDSAETLLLNLIRGTGLAGLQGIPPRSGRWIRPLICTEKREIEEYIRENGLETAWDESNFTGDNARARLRREVLPALEGLNGQALRHMAQASLDVWQRDEGLRAQADAAAKDFVPTEEGVNARIAALLALPQEVRARTLQLLQRQAGGKMLSRAHLEALEELLRQDRPTGETFLPGTRAVRRKELLLITALPPPETPQERTLLPGKTVLFGEWQVALSEQAAPDAVTLPQSACALPLSVRSRREGDAVMMPYGTKTLKKLMIERKISKDLRDRIPIICNNRNEILLVPGLWRLPASAAPGEPVFHIICRRKEK